MLPNIEWESEKALLNFKKHGISFSQAVSALED